MSMRSSLLVAAAVLVFASGAAAETPNLGQSVTEAELALWDISIAPDGVGLPPGSGTPAQGEAVYAKYACGLCHGDKGAGGPGGALVGGGPLSGTATTPAKLIGNYWPYATTIFDFTRRAMPFQAPRTLTNDDVYSLTAYILSINKLIGENDVMNAQTLPKVQMPNRDGFIIRFPDKI